MKKLKKSLLVIVACSCSILGYANNVIHELGEIENVLQIEIKSESAVYNIEHGFDTSVELFELDVFDLLASIKITDEFCTVSITVRVRVGVDSNFIEVSATVSDIPCEDVAETARQTIEQLKAGIK